jgi:H+/gluconate symporter-like permease
VKYKGKKLDAYKNTWFKKKQQDQNKEAEVSDGKFLHPIFFSFSFACVCHVSTEVTTNFYETCYKHCAIAGHPNNVFFNSLLSLIKT